MRKIYLFTVITIVLFSACSKDKVNFDAAKQLQKEIKLIKAYLTEHSLTATKTASGLYYIITKEGIGDTYPTTMSTITVHYKGYYLNGKTIFDQTQTGSPTTFSLSTNIISGWKEAITFLKQGGKGTFFIPSSLAYGVKGSKDGNIKPNTVLVFDVELVSFEN
jgi:FKBP-type peptidyl-prolyl cis-trans isomerase FkpA